MAEEKQAEIYEKYRGESYATIVKTRGRFALLKKDDEEHYRLVMKIHENAGSKFLQNYQVNQMGGDILNFAVTQMNRGVRFGDLSKLLS